MFHYGNYMHILCETIKRHVISEQTLVTHILQHVWKYTSPSFSIQQSANTHTDRQPCQDMGWIYSCMCTWASAYLRIHWHVNVMPTRANAQRCTSAHTLSTLASMQMIFRQDITWQFVAWMHLNAHVQCTANSSDIASHLFYLYYMIYFFALYG